MVERSRPGESPRPASGVFGVVVPVALLFVVIAIVSGLVFGGVLRGDEERLGPVDPSTTVPTIIIEP